MNIQPYTPDRSAELADLFHLAVHAIDSDVYSPEQKEAWAPTPPDYGEWQQRLDLARPCLLLHNKVVVGFMGINGEGYLQYAYTHPDYEGQGVAATLYAFLEKQAMVAGLTRLYVHASLVAKPFFLRRGFLDVSENSVERNGVTLANYTMEKRLG